MIITKEEFEGLQQGDIVSNGKETLEVQARIGKVVLVVGFPYNESSLGYVYSYWELVHGEFCLVKPVTHNCGFPLGDYRDKMVYVFVSDTSIEQAELNAKSSKSSPTRLKTVTKDYFETVSGHKFEYAVLCKSDSIELVR